MGCSTCKSGGIVAGCRNNGGCQTGGCNKMNAYDWLSEMELPSSLKFHIVEVRFKSGRKDFFRNSEDLDITTGDPVVVDVPNGHHVGFVSLQGELVRLQMKKKGISDDDEVRKIYRIATDRDLEKLASSQNRESNTLYRTRQIIQELELEMKLTDVEFQGDNSKATFYYSAEDRVDFRELIKRLAAEFKIRVEMRQISLRQEAGRIGGFGSCGRELCCSTWLSDFKSVTISAARYQKLSLNPAKLSGQCGRLKCCLNYELETYVEALKDIPEVQSPLLTEKGSAILQKTDIFRKLMWFGYENENTWHPVGIERVIAIQSMNEKGKKPASLLEDTDVAREEHVKAVSRDLERLDKKFSERTRKKKRNKKRKKNNTNRRRPNDKNQ